jgi:hypothetical protein
MSADPDEPADYMQCREVWSLRASADSGRTSGQLTTEDQRPLGDGPTIAREGLAEKPGYGCG